MRTPLALALLAALAACGPYVPPLPPSPPPDSLAAPRTGPDGATLQEQNSRTQARLQAVSVVNDRVVWVSGTGGTFAITTNGGASWRTGVVPAADSLQFRDVHGVDDKTAYLLAAGNGTQSRIYKTADAGQNWQIQFINRDKNAFYDCFAFWDAEHGLAFGDNVNGIFTVLLTKDGGQHWRLISDPDAAADSPVPPATQGEGGFAASGTCVATVGKDAAYIATGAGTESRILFTPDRGATWTSRSTPITQGTNTTGHTSVAFADAEIGLAVGGDIAATAAGRGGRVVRTTDGGATWTAGGEPAFPGAAYGVAYVPGSKALAVAVGPGGASVTRDDGRTWTTLDTLPYWSAGFANAKGGWLVGPNGRITKVAF